MAELDNLLSASLKRVAQPGDTAGVADAIRDRVAAGDPGTPASSSGFGKVGVGSWLPWIGVVVVAALVGGSMGVSGLISQPRADSAAAEVTAMVVRAAPASSCPGGPSIGSVPADTRVLVVARNEDDTSVGIRDPDDVAKTLWLDHSNVVIDAGDRAELPVLPECPVVVPVTATVTPSPMPTVTPTPTPTPTTDPAPAAPDTTGPTMSASAKPDVITMKGYSAYCGTDVSTVSVTAADPSGIAAVNATWSGGSAMLADSGSTWSFGFSGTSTGADVPYTITLTAIDGAGNSSSSVVVVTVQYCLI